MRMENRNLSTENRRLSAEIEQIEAELQELNVKHQVDVNDFETRMKATAKQIEIEVAQRAQQRKDRRKMMMAEVRKQTEANKQLSSQIHAIESEIARIKDIHEAFPSRYSQKKTVRKKSALSSSRV